MKKMITAGLISMAFLTSNVMAEEMDLYAGLDVVVSQNTFDVDASGLGSSEDDIDSVGFKLKFGTEFSESWRVQGYYSHEIYDDAPFDQSNEALNEIGIDLIKTFEVTSKFSPFVQVGAGFAWMDVDGYSESSINAWTGKVGLGAMYKVTPEFEAVLGFDYQYRQWQDINVGPSTAEIDEKSTKFYIGANVHF